VTDRAWCMEDDEYRELGELYRIEAEGLALLLRKEKTPCA
jgi:hypothetical protein